MVFSLTDMFSKSTHTLLGLSRERHVVPVAAIVLGTTSTARFCRSLSKVEKNYIAMVPLCNNPNEYMASQRTNRETDVRS